MARVKQPVERWGMWCFTFNDWMRGPIDMATQTRSPRVFTTANAVRREIRSYRLSDCEPRLLTDADFQIDMLAKKRVTA